MTSQGTIALQDELSGNVTPRRRFSRGLLLCQAWLGVNLPVGLQNGCQNVAVVQFTSGWLLRFDCFGMFCGKGLSNIDCMHSTTRYLG